MSFTWPIDDTAKPDFLGTLLGQVPRQWYQYILPFIREGVDMADEERNATSKKAVLWVDPINGPIEGPKR
jgi:hypothetical protein